MTRDIIGALRFVQTHDASNDIWRLAGPRNAMFRADIMSKLLGRRATQAESGINALTSELMRAMNVPAGTTADREDALHAAIVKALNEDRS